MPMTLRPYRAKALVSGQTSPPNIGHTVITQVVGDSVADIGCGSGVTGYLLRAAWEFTEAFQVENVERPTRLVGVDWSAGAIAALERLNPYDEALLASAARLPIDDKSVDTAISMENLEHLLPTEVPTALNELARIARRRIVISTPSPWAVTNVPFLTDELAAAQADPDPMPYGEFINLVGRLHKSSVTPEQMQATGFHVGLNRLKAPAITNGSIIYSADPADVEIARLGDVCGISWANYPAEDGRADWRDTYTEAVRLSLAMTTPRKPTPGRRLTVAAMGIREALRGDV